MKRLLIPLLVLILLVGCADGGEEATVTTTCETTAPTEPCLYVTGSEIEQQTGGALKQYALSRQDYYGVSAMGDQLLLLSGTERTMLEVYAGDACVLSGSVELPGLLESGLQSLYNGFAYYDAANNRAVYLDSQLQTARSVGLPDDIQGTPAFSPDGGEVFYCAGQEIRAFDTERGLSRLIKSHSCVSQTLLGAYFEGKLVLCAAENEAGETSLLYVSTEDGGTKGSNTGIEQLDTADDTFFAVRMDGITRQYIFGTADAVQQLNPADAYAVSAVAIGGAVGMSPDENGAWNLSYYDLSTGKKTAEVTLPRVGEPISVFADRWSNSIWILTDSGEAQTLLRWYVTASSVNDDTVCTGPVYTAQSPDEAGLDALQDRVDAMNRTYGVMVRIWETALKTSGGYDLKSEYQTAAISDCLDRVEQVLARFPEDFLYKSVGSKIRICIVRSVGGQVAAAQRWDDGDAYVFLSAGVDVETELMYALSYIVDSHIIGNSPLPDAWESLNPEGFTYGSGAQTSELLEGSTRAFADATSMDTVSDDRARIFWQAMQPDNGEMFASETMQAKLLLLCRSIRDAWHLEYKTETYPWEQYLSQPIAYVK